MSLKTIYIVIIAAAAAVVLVGIQVASAGGSCRTHSCESPSSEQTPTPQPGKKKHTVTAQEVLAVGLLIGTPIYCGRMRWVEKDPCIDFNQWRKTSDADDRVTPPPQAPGFGLNVEVTR